MIPTAPETPTDAGSDWPELPEASSFTLVGPAIVPATATPKRRPVLRASSVRPVASMVLGGPTAPGGVVRFVPMTASVFRVTRLTAALAPRPNTPAVCAAPATL